MENGINGAPPPKTLEQHVAETVGTVTGSLIVTTAIAKANIEILQAELDALKKKMAQLEIDLEKALAK